MKKNNLIMGAVCVLCGLLSYVATCGIGGIVGEFLVIPAYNKMHKKNEKTE